MSSVESGNQSPFFNGLLDDKRRNRFRRGHPRDGGASFPLTPSPVSLRQATQLVYVIAGGVRMLTRSGLMQPYGDDLAYIHDAGFGGFARDSAPGLLEILSKHGVTGGLVVDLGCGSGLWARHLADAGYDPLGVDISPAMLRMARKRVPEARFRKESFLSFAPPPCRAVTALGEPFNYLFDKRNNMDRLARLFERVYSALDAGGVFIFDVAEPGRDRGRAAGFREGKDWVCLTHFDYNAEDRQLTRHIVTFRKAGRLYRRHEEIHRLRLFRGTDVADALRAAGFRVRTVRRYGEFRLPKSLVGFVARKP